MSLETIAQAYQIYQSLLTQMRHLPHVSGLATVDAFNATMLTPRGGYGPVLFTQVQLVTSDDGMFTRQDRLTITGADRPCARIRWWPPAAPPRCCTCTWARDCGGDLPVRRAPTGSRRSTASWS